MFLSRAATPRAAAYTVHSWDEMQEKFRNLFFSGTEYDAGRSGAEKLSPIAAAHRILCNDFGMIPRRQAAGDRQYKAKLFEENVS